MNTVISLYSCWKCGKIKDEAEASGPTGCSCGSRMVSPAEPTANNVLRYFLSHPKQALRFLWELPSWL